MGRQDKRERRTLRLWLARMAFVAAVCQLAVLDVVALIMLLKGTTDAWWLRGFLVITVVQTFGALHVVVKSLLRP
jgi:hypothetical protein